MESHFMPTEKLTGSQNYHTWSRAARAYLQLSDLWECIEPKENTNSSTLQNKDEKAMSTLMLLIDPVIYIHVRDARSAKAIWDTLSSTFKDSGLQAKVTLLKELTKTKLETSNTVEGYINKIMNIGSKLKNIGFIDDEWLAVYMLAGLPDEYKLLIEDIESSGVTVSAELIKIKILHKAGTLQNQNNQLQAVKRFNLNINGYNKNRKKRKTKPTREKKSQMEKSSQIATTTTQPVQQDRVSDQHNNEYVRLENDIPRHADVDQPNHNPPQDATSPNVSQEVVFPKIEIKEEFSYETFQSRLDENMERRQAIEEIINIESSDEEDSQRIENGPIVAINGIEDEETQLIPSTNYLYAIDSQTQSTPEKDAVRKKKRSESPEWRPHNKIDGFVQDYTKAKLKRSRSQSVKIKNYGTKSVASSLHVNDTIQKPRNIRSQSFIHEYEKLTKTSAISHDTNDQDSKLRKIINNQSTFVEKVILHSFSDLRSGMQDIHRLTTFRDFIKAKKASIHNLNLIVNGKTITEMGTIYGRIQTSHILDVMQDIIGNRAEKLSKPIIKYIYCLTDIYIQNLGYKMVCKNISCKVRDICDNTVREFLIRNSIDTALEDLLKEAERIPIEIISPHAVELIILRSFLVMAAPKCVIDAENMIKRVDSEGACIESQLLMNIFTLARMTDQFKLSIRALAIRFLQDVAERLRRTPKFLSVSRSRLQAIISSNDHMYQKFLFDLYIADDINNKDMNYETDS